MISLSGLNLNSGQLALITLAMGARRTPDEIIYDNHLLSHLENKFQAEMENMGESQMFSWTNLSSPPWIQNYWKVPFALSTPSLLIHRPPSHLLSEAPWIFFLIMFSWALTYVKLLYPWQQTCTHTQNNPLVLHKLGFRQIMNYTRHSCVISTKVSTANIRAKDDQSTLSLGSVGCPWGLVVEHTVLTLTPNNIYAVNY